MYQPSKFITRHRSVNVDYSNYYYFSNAFTENELLLITNMGKKTAKETASVTDQGVVSETRISEVGWIPHDDESNWLYEKIADFVIEANDTLWNFDISGYHDQFQYTTYYGGGGHYDWHTDVGPGMANRKVSIVCQLTKPEEYTGGDLNINGGRGILTAPRDYNTVIIFPSFVLHRVTPVLTGTRTSLVTWLAGPPLQ
jgi:PKHD-type hydroxylase